MELTHEELLYRMNWASERYHDTDGRAQYFDALRAVVELHKPIKDDWFNVGEIVCQECTREEYTTQYPCPTIQAIQRELE